MRHSTILATLIAAACLSGCGGADTSQTLTVTPLAIDSEQAVQIRKQDEVIDAEEGGPQKVVKPVKKRADLASQANVADLTLESPGASPGLFRFSKGPLLPHADRRPRIPSVFDW